MIGLGARPERIGALLGPAASGERYEVPAVMQQDVEAHLPGSACTTVANTTRSRHPRGYPSATSRGRCRRRGRRSALHHR